MGLCIIIIARILAISHRTSLCLEDCGATIAEQQAIPLNTARTLLKGGRLVTGNEMQTWLTLNQGHQVGKLDQQLMFLLQEARGSE